jgi:protoporphyrinogen oxidase
LEYFAFEGDDLWALGDEELKDLAKREIEKIFMNQTFEITDACVVRQRKAYPVYDEHYQNNIRIIREELEEKFPSLHLVGRNGMHKYNNQDHAMMTSMLTVENIIAGKRVYDVWKVNQDAEYHEEPAGGSNKK